MPRRATWDLFCRVIDNYGDIGVCWRLATGLAARGQTVRLWTDDATALRWMAPRRETEASTAAADGGANGARAAEIAKGAEDAEAGPRAPNVQVGDWTAATGCAPGDVVVEAFACDPPEAFVAAMARQAPPPLWINLEYLSAEPWVERCHGLPSPQSSGPGRGLTKLFFHPGFTSATGGLLREEGLLEARAGFDRAQAWAELALPEPLPGEQVVTVFSYPSAPWRQLPGVLNRPSLLLLTPGAAQALATSPLPPGVRAVVLPWLTQPQFDRLLWAADLNLVRGEDSLVRALWAGRPLVWQLYPQDDGAHIPKLEAFCTMWARLSGADAGLAAQQRALMRWWNGVPAEPVHPDRPAHFPGWPAGPAWAQASGHLAAALGRQQDLVSALLEFVEQKAARAGL